MRRDRVDSSTSVILMLSSSFAAPARTPRSLTTLLTTVVGKDIPDDIRRELVSDLFGNVGSLVAGGVCGALACFVVATRNDNVALYACAGAMVAIFIVRAGIAARFKAQQARPPGNGQDLDRWERRYAIGAVLFAACCGLMCYTAYIQTNDVVGQLVPELTTLGYAADVTA